MSDNTAKLAVAVDDDPVWLMLHTIVLQEAGYEVISFKTVDEGMDFCKTNTPDLVVTDNETPSEHTGLDFLEYLKERNIPRVIVSSSEIEGQVKERGGEGAIFYKKDRGPNKNGLLAAYRQARDAAVLERLELAQNPGAIRM